MNHLEAKNRRALRSQVWEMSGGRCEHPVEEGRCREPATELAHIHPRGMGHKGARDYLGNVMAACPLHARSTDDLSSSEWQWVDGGRDGLAATVAARRASEGFDVHD